MSSALRRVIPLYFLGVNGLSAGLIVEDKRRAVQHQWRIPERNLIAVGAAGGFPGGYLAMRYAHHKTQKKSFREQYDQAAMCSAAVWAAVLFGLRRGTLPLASLRTPPTTRSVVRNR
ncbi:hypothetical protein CCYA_CCYA06G1847 [Cyanidiococcus yangmingshanensis]|nr:hypothetical protein CCYA_CCYA06G1847 [Cyanidiococcus yangmingshanensis]